ncbi:hypothetical protein S40285_09447 [Stachybotrys chlorohalonatus IBT 40285]|uniref:Rhodopsin domain-containing protein n=1 Tax=Stachybotrys chlorohalonatus (strain IBT 40285) TaxID=1283841 RepID=A0A084R200_STAC4|nr:hypothetical protein S40285_09447 [Stachybotrys chlorohalonata IBT 40285]
MSVFDLPTSGAQIGAIAIELIFCIFAIIVASVRIYARQKLKMLGWGIRYMFIGLRAVDVPLVADYETAFIWGYAMGVVYNPILALTKMSVLLFLLRFSGIVQRVRYVTWGIFTFNTLQMIAMFLVVVFQCIPFAKNWNSSLEGRCVDTWAFTITTSILTIVTDIVCIALPLYILKGLNMSSRKKLGLMVVFGFGILTTAFSCIRLYFLYQTFNSNNPDDRYSITFTFSAIEVNLAIATASAPGIWPLIANRLGSHTRVSKSGVSFGNEYGRSGWIKTDNGSLPTQRQVNGDIDLQDMRSHGHANARKGSFSGDSKEEILSQDPNNDYGIRKETQVEVIISKR